MVVLLCLSDPVFTEFLSEWLVMEDVYSLDMAFAEKRHRSHFLVILCTINRLDMSNMLPYNGNNAFLQLINRRCSFNYVQWIGIRGLKVPISIEVNLGYSGVVRMLSQLNTRRIYFAFVSNLRIHLKRTMEQTVISTLDTVLHGVFRVFPRAKIQIVVDFTPICCRKLLAIQSFLFGHCNIEGYIIMYVPDPPLHSFWHRTRDPAELPDQHNPERTEFFQLFGRQVLDVTTMIDLDSVKRFPTIDKTIWFLFHYCPSLVAMPFRREINSTSLTYFSKYSMVMLKEVSYSISDVNMLQCLFDENNAVLINLPQSQNKLEDISMLFDHNRLAPSIFTERSIPIILAIFQRCPCLHSLSIDRVLKWRRTSDFSLLSFYFPASLAIYQWVSFLDDLADCLPTITRVELQLTRGESYSTSMDPYILTVFQKLQTAPCFATVRHMTLAGGMAQVSDVSMYVLPNIAHVEITYMLIPEASLLTHLATSSLLLCFPNVKTLHINYFSTLSHNGSGFCTAIMGAIDLLPCLDELIIVDSASYLTDHFIHALASKGRVWKTLDFSIRQSDFLALQATRVSLRAAMLQGLLVVKKLVLRETHLKVIESLGYGNYGHGASKLLQLLRSVISQGLKEWTSAEENVFESFGHYMAYK